MSTGKSPQRDALSYSSYLAAKKTVDDRALNQHVIDVLRAELTSSRSTTVLEIGAGIGTMVSRLADWHVLCRANYTLLDIDQASLEHAQHWLCGWAAEMGLEVQRAHDALHITGGSPALDLEVHSVCADLRAFLGENRRPNGVDLLIASAFLDLVDVAATLPALLERVAPNGLYWFSINFDGETIFLPEHPSDASLMSVYHRSMDERTRLGRRAGDSRTGRHLFQHLRSAGARILAAGSSDWIVHAIDGEYAAQEGDFLGHILHTIEAELNSRSEVDQHALHDWLRVRRDQLERGDLVYIAHQLDFVGRRSG
jgi:SAM-dependent methyltransferase